MNSMKKPIQGNMNMMFWLLVIVCLISNGTQAVTTSDLNSFYDGSNNKTRPPACGANHACDCHQTKKAYYLVDCSKHALQVVPRDVPINVTQLDLSRNVLSEILPDLLQSTVNLTSFKINNNFVRAIPDTLFLITYNLKEVDFSGNRLMEIPIGLLSSANNIESIDFSENSISDIPYDLLVNRPNLQRFDISHNKIGHLWSQMFNGTPKLNALDLSYNRISQIPPGMFSKTPLLELLFFSGNNLTEISPDLFKLFSDNSITELPEDMFASTPLVTTIDFGRNNLTKLSQNTFQTPRDLSKLLLSANKIRNLPNNLFQGLKKLETIELFKNDLTDLPCNMFTGLTNLGNLFLLENNIKVVCPSIFHDSVKLTEISMALNGIRRIPRTAFWTTQQLKGLSLSQNNIEAIPEGLLAYLPDLQRVDLSHNEYDEIPADIFYNTTKLTSISLMGTNLKDLPANLFATTFDITSLKLSKNQLKAIGEETFFSTPILESIDLSHNKIEKLQSTIFSHNTELVNVDLSSNRLTSLPGNLFEYNPSLLKLQVANNLLSDLPAGFFNWTPNLGYLVLSNNHLDTVHRRYLNGLKLFYLSLSGNAISQLPVDFFSNVSISYCIDLANNSLTEIPLGLFNSSLSKLGANILLLQRNKLTRVQNGTFNGLTSLSTIFLSNNEINELDDDAFANMPIENIYLFSNKLTELKNTSFQKSDRMLYLHIYKNDVEYISERSLEKMPYNAKILLSCDKLKHLPWANRSIESECVTSSYVPVLEFKKLKDIIYVVLRQQGFGCTLSSRRAVCRPCSPGTYGNESGQCSPCPAGGFYQDDLGSLSCNHCYNGSFVKYGHGSSVLHCKVCPEGTDQSKFAGYRACPCKANYTRLHRFEKCSVCLDEGLDCSQDYKALLPGFYWNWTFPNASLLEYSQFVFNLQTKNSQYDHSTLSYTQLIPRAFACSRPESCVNNNSHDFDGIAGSCTEGYTGWICSKCDKGFYSVLGFCLPCPYQLMVILEFVAVLCVLILFMLFVIFKNKKQRNADRTVADIVSSRVKILLGFYQVVGELFEAFHGVSWAGVLQYVGEFISILKFNILRLILKPNCLHEKLSFDPKMELKIALSFPVIVILVAIACHFVCRLYFRYKKRYNQNDLKNRLEQVKSTLCTYVFLLLFVTYPPTCDIIFSLYPGACDTFELYKESNLTITLLRADYDLLCSDLFYYQVAAFVATVTYVLSFPLFLLILLRKYNKSELVEAHTYQRGTIPPNRDDCSVNETTNLLGNSTEDNENRNLPIWLNFLCENFRPQFWFWEILELARKVAQTMLITLLGWDDPLTKLTAIGTAVLFLTLHVKFSPMKCPFEQRLQLFSLAVIFINVLVAAVPMSNSYGNIISIGIITLDAGIMVIVSGEAIRPLYRYIKGKCQRRHMRLD
ncbi:uncharacterized protein [Apostichopus japonicus]|uniref:uncharacterized protein isoform X2 n=1 Tax=Stichopus japonicus TaxID=307972 RepID=UPI003AB7A936